LVKKKIENQKFFMKSYGDIKGKFECIFHFFLAIYQNFTKYQTNGKNDGEFESIFHFFVKMAKFHKVPAMENLTENLNGFLNFFNLSKFSQVSKFSDGDFKGKKFYWQTMHFCP